MYAALESAVVHGAPRQAMLQLCRGTMQCHQAEDFQTQRYLAQQNAMSSSRPWQSKAIVSH